MRPPVSGPTALDFGPAPRPVRRVPRVCRPSVRPYACAVAAALDLLGVLVVVLYTEGDEVACVEEAGVVALVGRGMVGNGGLPDVACIEAPSA